MDNLAKLKELLLNLIARLQPDSLKVFVDACWYLPFNAHFVFYRNRRLVVDDVRAIGSVWRNGLAQYGLPSLQKYPDGNDFAFSELLTRDFRVDIWRKLAAVISFSEHVSEDDVEAALCADACEWQELDGGFVASASAYIFNTQLYDFYVEVLENCKRRSLA